MKYRIDAKYDSAARTYTVDDTRPDCSDVSYMNGHNVSYKPTDTPSQWGIDYSKVEVRGDRDERDPNGIPAGVPGAKLDAGKIDVTRGCLHYFPRSLNAVAELSTIGAKKYSWKGWESVSDGIHRYGGALGRHELRIEGDYARRDPDTNVLEATAVAWNALARLELILRQTEVESR